MEDCGCDVRPQMRRSWIAAAPGNLAAGTAGIAQTDKGQGMEPPRLAAWVSKNSAVRPIAMLPAHRNRLLGSRLNLQEP